MEPAELVRCLECREVYDPEKSGDGDVGCPSCGCVSWIAVAFSREVTERD